MMFVCDVNVLQAALAAGTPPIMEGGVVNSVALIPIHGVMAKGSWWGVDPEDITAAVKSAQADASVGSVLLHVFSPGGSVFGVKDLHDAVEACAEEKPVYAFVDGICCSGAMWAVSASSEIWCGRDSFVGSVGVYSGMFDVSEAFANAGIRTVFTSTGPLKGAGFPGVPITKAQENDQQKDVDALFELFSTDIRTDREQVQTNVFKGGTFIGMDAIKAGLVDQIGCFEDCLKEAHQAGVLLNS